MDANLIYWESPPCPLSLPPSRGRTKKKCVIKLNRFGMFRVFADSLGCAAGNGTPWVMELNNLWNSIWTLNYNHVAVVAVGGTDSGHVAATITNECGACLAPSKSKSSQILGQLFGSALGAWIITCLIMTYWLLPRRKRVVGGVMWAEIRFSNCEFRWIMENNCRIINLD